MGDQKDGLRGLTRFSDNEGDIIWQHRSHDLTETRCHPDKKYRISFQVPPRPRQNLLLNFEKKTVPPPP